MIKRSQLKLSSAASTASSYEEYHWNPRNEKINAKINRTGYGSGFSEKASKNDEFDLGYVISPSLCVCYENQYLIMISISIGFYWFWGIPFELV